MILPTAELQEGFPLEELIDENNFISLLFLKAEAEEQLNKYSADEKFKKNLEKTTLIKLVLIFSGHRPVHMGKVD